MRRRLSSIYSPAIRHRAVQVATDGCLVAAAFYLSFALRFDLQGIPDRYQELLIKTIAFVVLGKLVIFALFGLYHKWWRYLGMRDFSSLLKAVVVSSLVLLVTLFFYSPVANKVEGRTAKIMQTNCSKLKGKARKQCRLDKKEAIKQQQAKPSVTLPRSIAALDFLITLALIAGVRFIIRSAVERPPGSALMAKGREVLIVGAGDGGRLVVREMVKNRSLGTTPIGYVDDDARKHGMRIDGLKVLGPTGNLAAILDDTAPDEVVIAIPSAPGILRQKVVTACRERSIPVRTLPTVFELLLSGVDIVRQIREVRVEDVLGRQPVILEVEQVGAYLNGQTVMVTGAGGSVGSELCRQIARVGVEKIVMLDHAEDNLFNIERELVEKRHFHRLEAVLADCKEEERMAEVFATYRPDVIFHAAAYKHVPLMEQNPVEAIRNNALATKVTAQLAAENRAQKFVLVSTDKAVNPVTVMGASKAMAEWVVEAWGARYPNTSFAAVRFGNVLASSGSVVPIFRRQIEAGGPVTVTDPEMRRYFMTIPEAVQLIIRAGGLMDDGNGGRGATYVLDMGEPVKVIDLARNMIRLSGSEPDRDIAIEIIGRRQGEKLFEELFNSYERPRPTGAEKIMVADSRMLDPHWVVQSILQVEELVLSGDEKTLISKVVEMSKDPRQLDAGLQSKLDAEEAVEKA